MSAAQAIDLDMAANLACGEPEYMVGGDNKMKRRTTVGQSSAIHDRGPT
jgi:hypothetical protein